MESSLILSITKDGERILSVAEMGRRFWMGIHSR